MMLAYIIFFLLVLNHIYSPPDDASLASNNKTMLTLIKIVNVTTKK